MKTVFLPFVFLGVIYAFNIMIAVASKRPSPPNSVRLSRAFLWIGAAGLALMLPVSIFSIAVFGERTFGYFCVIAAVLFSLFIFAYYGFDLVYDDDTITYRYFFEERKTIKIRDVKRLRKGLDLVIETKEKRLTVRNYMSGTDELYLHLQSRVSEKQQTEVKKVIRFSEAVERPGEFIAVYILVSLVHVGLWIMVIVFSSDNWLGYVLAGALSVPWAAIVFLSVHSAKRARSSLFWRRIALALFRKGYLREN